MTAPWNGRPPAPLDEVDGWHMMMRRRDARNVVLPVQWIAAGNFWENSGRLFSSNKASDKYFYVAPCQTPDQIAAQIAEAVKAEREERLALERRVMRAADAIMNISTDAMEGDNLAVILCSHFESADDETEVGENGWSEAVTDAYEDVRKEIKRLVDEAIRAHGETA